MRHAKGEVEKPMLGSTLYDYLKWVAQILLPALGALYFALSTIWGLPAGEQVVGTITVVDVFLGALLSLSNRSYNASGAKYDGEMLATGNPDQPHSLSFNVPLVEMATHEQIVLKVVPVP